MPRWRERFTLRRVTETVTIERDDTEDLGTWGPSPVMHQWRVVREPPPAPHPLDLSVPWPRHLTAAEPAPIGQYLLEHPPVRARWRQHHPFTVDQARRDLIATTGAQPLDPLPPVPYRELAEDTLAGEFAAVSHHDLS